MQISNFGDVLREVVYLKRSTNGGLGAEPPAARGFGGFGAKPTAVGRFFVSFLEKTAILMPLNHISHVFRAI